MRKFLKWLNHFLWKHYGFALRIVHPYNDFTPKEGKMYFVYVGLSDLGYKAIFRNGEYQSIMDGKKIEFISKVQEFI